MAGLPIPPQLIVLDIAGVVLAGAGLAGLLSDLSFVHPALADQHFAGMIAGAGFALMTFAGIKIVQHLRARRLYPPEQT